KETAKRLRHISDGDGVECCAVLTIGGAIVGASLCLAAFGTAAAPVSADVTLTKEIVRLAESVHDLATRGIGHKANITGDTDRAVLASMKTAIVSVHTEITEKQEDVRRVLREAYNDVLTARNRYEIMVGDNVPPMSREALGNRELNAQESYLINAATES